MEFFGLNRDELAGAIRAWGWPPFRAGQLFDWVYGKGVTDPAAMTNLSKGDRVLLAQRLSIAPATITRRQVSSDGTIKLLLTWPDGKNAETVMIPDEDRRTACVSSQVGCPVGCTFCASGVNGVQGNLSAAQIVEQIHAINAELLPHREHVTNVVFMGMGEPLANYAAVMKACEVLHDESGYNVGYRRLTISTVGVPAKIRQLAEEGHPINLAFSMHAPNEALRRELIPWADHFALEDILAALRYYFDQTGRELTLEYILLAGVNDRPEHAQQLARACRTLRANVNLIRYNEVAGLPYRRPESAAVVRFQEVLRKAGVNAHVRKSRGRDIDAACGQLRRREEEKRAAAAPAEDAATAAAPAEVVVPPGVNKGA